MASNDKPARAAECASIACRERRTRYRRRPSPPCP